MTTNIHTINPIIGDESFIVKFGRSPTQNDSKHLRTKVHLQYVHDLLKNRGDNIHLHHLQEYINNEKFPVHTNSDMIKKPRFVDHNHTLCAVAHIIQQSSYRMSDEELDQFNKIHEYHHIYEMDEIKDWFPELSHEDLQLIQPRDYSRDYSDSDDEKNSHYVSEINEKLEELLKPNVCSIDEKIVVKQLLYQTIKFYDEYDTGTIKTVYENLRTKTINKSSKLTDEIKNIICTCKDNDSTYDELDNISLVKDLNKAISEDTLYESVNNLLNTNNYELLSRMEDIFDVHHKSI